MISGSCRNAVAACHNEVTALVLCIGLGAGRQSISLSITIGIVLRWGCRTGGSCRNKVTVLIGVSKVVARGYCLGAGPTFLSYYC